MSWDIEKITRERAIAGESLKGATMEQVLSRLAEVEAALYALTAPLSSLDIAPGPRCSAYATSKLFPSVFDGIKEDHYPVYDHEKHDFVSTDIPDEKLHEISYSMADSISIVDGSKLHDDFSIIHVHQSGMCSYTSCGGIQMRDVRRAAALLGLVS